MIFRKDSTIGQNTDDTELTDKRFKDVACYTA